MEGGEKSDGGKVPLHHSGEEAVEYRRTHSMANSTLCKGVLGRMP